MLWKLITVGPKKIIKMKMRVRKEVQVRQRERLEMKLGLKRSFQFKGN